MSNPLAIATVTQTLQNVLTEALGSAHVAGAHVTATRPDDKANLPNPGVNVFLYQVAPNPALRNSDLPTRGADGSLLQLPTAALDLFYLFTFYGDDTRLEQQRLLGAVTLAMHAQPWLAQADILAAQGTSFLAGADLADAREKVRFRPVSFTLEELSKLWSFLLKTDYVLSAAYVGSVVQIDLPTPLPPPALPVLAPRVLVLPLQPPVVASIAPSAGGSVILPGAQVDLVGSNLAGPAGTVPAVLVGGTTLVPSAAGPTRITVTLPATLQAGLQTAIVVQQPLLGTPFVVHAGGVQSAPAPFTLAPLIRRSGAAPPVYQVQVQTGLGSPPSDTVAVTLDPVVQTGQRAVLALLPTAPAGARPLLFDGGVAATPTNTIAFPIGIPPSGSYFVQVLVDTAESPLDTDASGQPIGPRISL